MSVEHLEAPSPFHAGERLVQQRLGVGHVEEWARKVVRDHMPGQHRGFFEALPFLIAGARDSGGRPWATLLSGPDGFVRSPDSRTLDLAARPVPGDALADALGEDTDLGLLGIELASRRRNRVNGRIRAAGPGGFSLQVAQSFGNCPQHIRQRGWRRVETRAGRARTGDGLTGAQRAWIRAADTFFIASGYRGPGEDAAYGMDVSHRGGEPGFVTVRGERQLRFPDYAGNNHFNTIGNLMLDPRAGLLFVDFETGGLLQITGRTTIEWDPAGREGTATARRWVTLDIDAVVELPSAVALRWDREAGMSRALRVVDKRRESADVASFLLAAQDGGPLPRFEAGQHLPVELAVPGIREPLRRSYSLSYAPDAPHYRIAVKRLRDGLASRHLHDAIGPGDVIDSRPPAGGFTLGKPDGKVVLIAAGIGLTPLLSMLYVLAGEDGHRDVRLIHAVRDGAHHPFAPEIRALAAARADFTVRTVCSRPRPQDRPGRDYDIAGRLDAARLERLIGSAEAQFYLCGPAGFMADMQATLERLGADPDAIRGEVFGPAG